MTGLTFQRARRTQARLRLALVAVSGAGKTMSALRLARGIVEQLIDMGVVEGTLEGKIAVIDTERASAALYSDVVPFDTMVLEPPYSVDRYQQALEVAERAGYVVCIIDQISHAWAGPGGQLEYIDTLKAQSRNAISPWAKVTPMQQEFYDRLLRSPMHIIATMRAKTEYVIDEVVGDGGRVKKVPRKIGMAPVQRDGIEYEFTACLDIDLEGHTATASKDRTRLFMGRAQRLDETVGRKVAEWLQSGEATSIAPEPPKADAGVGNAKSERELALMKLTNGVEDYKLSFLEMTTLPELAERYELACKFVRAFKDVFGSEVISPILVDVAAAKDARKKALTPLPAGYKSVLIDKGGIVLGEVEGKVQECETVKIGAVDYEVGPLSTASAAGACHFAKRVEAPAPSGDLLDGADRAVKPAAQPRRRAAARA